MKITPHFYLHEFKCRDGTAYPAKWIDDRLFPLCKNLEIIRKAVKKVYGEEYPIYIMSGYRTRAHNARQPGAAKNSLHVRGMAVDFRCVNQRGKKWVSAKNLGRIIEDLIRDQKIPDGGFKAYRYHVHYDLGRPRRW